jgi:hypothetical protein
VRRRRRHGPTLPVWLAAVLLLPVVAVSVSAACWIALGGDFTGLPWQLPFAAEQADAAGTADGVPVRIDSTPAGAEVLVDGVRRGRAPALLPVSSGSHTLLLRQSESIDALLPFDVQAEGASVSVSLWRRKPDVVPLRPVYPGASMGDARFLADGGLTVSVTTGPGSSGNITGPTRELWHLDPATGNLTHLSYGSPSEALVSAVALAPDGRQVAYATGGSTTSVTLWPTSNGASPTEGAGARLPSVRVSDPDGSNQRTVFAIDHGPRSPATDTEHITDVVWMPDGQHLVVVTRMDTTPARARLVLVTTGAAKTDDEGPTTRDLVVLPAEVLRNSAVVDSGSGWLAFLAHATSSSNTTNTVTLCVVQLRGGSTFRDVTDLGPAQRLAAVAPLVWAPTSPEAMNTQARLAFVAPVPAANTSSGTGLFDIFGALQPGATPTGLFVLDLNGSAAGAFQPRRIGTVTGLAAPVWRDQSTIYGFLRRADGSLSLQAVDVSSGIAHDTGALISPGTVQGSGLSARWDVERGRALLLTHPAGGSTNNPSPTGLQAWLVLFLPPNEVKP